MTTVRATLLAVIGWSCAGPALDAQSLTRVEAAIADLSADGRPNDHGLFLFRTCPQDDPAGRAVFDAVKDMPLDPWGLQQLAGMLTFQVYPNCGYAPLNEWYVGVLEKLRADRALGPGEAFVIRLGDNEARLVTPDMQEALIRAAEDPGFIGGRYEEEMIRIALTHRPRELWIAEAISAFRRAIPSQTITFATYSLSREFGSEFYERIASEAPTLSDDVFLTIIRALSTEIQDQRADPNAAGMGALREMAERRARSPSDELLRAPRPALRDSLPFLRQ
jgi:hypothetical protein